MLRPEAASSFRTAPTRFPALTMQALADGIMDASLLRVYETRYREPEIHNQRWLDNQPGKVERGLANFEADPPALSSPPHVGQIALACALGYQDLRFEGKWRATYPRLVAWLDDFAARFRASRRRARRSQYEASSSGSRSETRRPRDALGSRVSARSARECNEDKKPGSRPGSHIMR